MRPAPSTSLLARCVGGDIVLLGGPEGLGVGQGGCRAMPMREARTFCDRAAFNELTASTDFDRSYWRRLRTDLASALYEAERWARASQPILERKAAA